MIHIQRVRHRPKVLIDLERTGAMRTSENCVKAKFSLPHHPGPERCLMYAGL
jgi:hypothetical protein